MRSVWLSPERETAPRLIRLLRQSMREGCSLVNLFFHTSSLQAGCTPFVRTGRDKLRLFATLSAVLKFCLDAGITPIPLSEAARKVNGASSSRH